MRNVIAVTARGKKNSVQDNPVNWSLYGGQGSRVEWRISGIRVLGDGIPAFGFRPRAVELAAYARTNALPRRKDGMYEANASRGIQEAATSVTSLTLYLLPYPGHLATLTQEA